MLHHGLVENVRSKECYITYTFFAFYVVFYQKIGDFLILISFFDEVSNFSNKISTNQKPE